MSAFQAFSDCFCAQWPEIQLADAEEPWTLAGALSFDTFMATLRRMRRRKAVGADGLGIDMLLAPGVPERVLQLYFQGLRGCALFCKFTEAWKRVIYVLLVKPRKDRRLVQERRDLALMAQGMKVLGRMMLTTAFHDMEARLAEKQLGWTKAVGASEASLMMHSVF